MMNTDKNRAVTLAQRPVGFPKESDFNLIETSIPIPAQDEILIRTLYLSVDPYMRGRISGVKSYANPLEIGDVMIGGAVGKVVQSHHSNFCAGDIVEGMFGWQDFAVARGDDVRKIDPELGPISTALGILGMPGMTAYFGLLDICNPLPGETVVVSGAAGAVGSLVGQIARIKGCRVVGIAGSDEKTSFLVNELGFDAAFNYKKTDDYVSVLRDLCPNGIDIYFDNVGGTITDAVIKCINVRARISVCGQISQYNLEKPEMGPRWLPQLIVKRARIEGFLVFDYTSKYREGLSQMSHWMLDGSLHYRETIEEGLEHAPRAFIGMLQGHNVGKQLVHISEG